MTQLTVRNEGLATFLELEIKVKPTLTRDGFQFELPNTLSSDADQQLAEWQMRYANSAVQQTIEIYIANSKAKRSMARKHSISE